MSGVYRILIFSGSDYIHTARAPLRLAVPGGVHTASHGLVTCFDFIELSFCSTCEATTRCINRERLVVGNAPPCTPLRKPRYLPAWVFGRSNFQISASIDAAILQYLLLPSPDRTTKHDALVEGGVARPRCAAVCSIVQLAFFSISSATCDPLVQERAWTLCDLSL